MIFPPKNEVNQKTPRKLRFFVPKVCGGKMPNGYMFQTAVLF